MGNLTDLELIRLAAEKVMGWRFPPPHSATLKMDGGNYMTFPNGEAVHVKSGYTWNPLQSDADAMMLVDKLAPLAGDYYAGDGFFILQYGEFADHGETGDDDGNNQCTFGGLSDEEPSTDELSWSAHFHVGLMGEGPTYPSGWDHGKKFCARAKDRRRAIILASLKAIGVDGAGWNEAPAEAGSI